MNSVIHIGDEAMFEEFVTQAKRRGVTQITGISSAPADTAVRYGIDSVQRMGFAATSFPTRADLDDRLDRILRTAAGQTALLEPDDPAIGVIAAIAASDGVAISGGGNLSSIWPENIYERVAFGGVARILGRPLVVSGQTIGPVLFGPDVALVSGLLASAALVGLREPASFALVSGFARDANWPAHAPRIQKTVDDASYLGFAADAADSEQSTNEQYCVVTLASHIGTLDEDGRTETGFSNDHYLESVAALLDHIATTTGLAIRFLAHFGSSDTAVSIGDTLVHERVMARLTVAVGTTVPTTDSIAAAAVARNAALVVTSRYHPAVFAVAAGVPTIGIPVDSYTTDKLTGALGNFGQSALLPAHTLVDGKGAALVSALWQERHDIRSIGIERSAVNRRAAAVWWDDVMVVLTLTH